MSKNFRACPDCNSQNLCKDCKRKENQRKKQEKWVENNLVKYLLRGAERRASKKGIECSIKPEDIELVTVCPILGVEMRRNDRIYSWDSYSLDRVDPNKGYVKGNVRIISWRANQLKKEMTEDQIKRLYQYVKGEI